MKKCTLRKVSQGVVATVDERPKEGDWILDYGVCSIYIDGDVMIDNGEFKTIIASTFGVGKELITKSKGAKFHKNMMGIFDFNSQYNYTETETQIIINL